VTSTPDPGDVNSQSSAAAASTGSISDAQQSRQNARRRRYEQFVKGTLFVCAAVSVLTTACIIFVLLGNAVYAPGEAKAFFEEVSLWEFLTDTHWKPATDETARFGILPLLCGTLMVAIIASVISVPIGLGAAVYLSEYARPGERAMVKPILEVLAGIPTIVYGFFALHFITPWLLQPFFRNVLGIEVGIFNVLSAGIVVGIMVIPMVASLSEDVLRSVPGSLREAAYALGGTRFDVSMRVVVPAALSGILAAFLLAFSRAIGETMAVTIAGGHKVMTTINPLEEARTMTAFMVHQSFGDESADSIAYMSIYAVGLALFVITLSINLISQWILQRFREVYQ
jgi:phosphate transport system permease protein